MRLAKGVFLLFLWGAGLAIVLAAFLFFYFSKELPTIEQIASRQIHQSTKIFDRTGKILLYEISSGEERTVVPLAEIPQRLKDATIAIEDKRFYESPGFDTKAILRAMWTNFRESGNPLEGQGASTITQQLAKNAFLTSERTLVRKAKELVLAMRISDYYTKDEILELYLNEIPYGSTIYGVEEASQAFFGKSVRDINIAEGAMLAAIPRAPSYYSPWGSHTKELFSRQKLVLEKMLGAGRLSEEEFEGALKSKIVFAPKEEGLIAPHFVLAVRDYLVQKYGENIVGTGGLRVVTTLNWELQQVAEKAVKSGAEENDKLYNGRNAALVAENPKTGEVLAMVGSRDYFATSSLPEGCRPGLNCQFEPNFNVATQGLRQPGSALKPFVYLTAFEKGYTQETVIFDVPTEFAANHPDCPPVVDYKNENSECFHPENFDELFRGPVSLRQALGQSVNIPAVKVLYLAGLEDSVKKAQSFGLETLNSPNLYGLSLVLGGGAVRLADLAEAYSTLANDGVKNEQIMVLEVKDANEKILESNKPTGKKVAEAQYVRTVNNILSDTNVRAGLLANSLYLTLFPEYDVALKTGTSNDYRDAWAMGYTPSLVVGVWAGNNDNSAMQKRGSSILAAVPIWSNFMREVINKFPKETFPRPESIIPQKPILGGQFAPEGQIHSILYYVSKKDPLGPAPSDSAGDPQFINWETALLAWAAKNLQNFASYNRAPATSTASITGLPPKVEIKSPSPGTFIAANKLEIKADIFSDSKISSANIYWNSSRVQSFSINVEKFYQLNWIISLQFINQQNLLEIEASDEKGFSSKAGVIVYKE